MNLIDNIKKLFLNKKSGYSLMNADENRQN